MVNFYWGISMAPWQWPWGMEAIAFVASVKYQAWLNKQIKKQTDRQTTHRWDTINGRHFVGWVDLSWPLATRTGGSDVPLISHLMNKHPDVPKSCKKNQYTFKIIHSHLNFNRSIYKNAASLDSKCRKNPKATVYLLKFTAGIKFLGSAYRIDLHFRAQFHRAV